MTKIIKSQNSARKLSRSKKKYWRKGTNVGDTESFFEQQQTRKLTDDPPGDLFIIERQPIKFTKKGSGLELKNLKLKCYSNLLPDVSASVESQRKSAKLQLLPMVKNKNKRKIISTEVTVERKKKPVANYDLWENDAKGVKLSAEKQDDPSLLNHQSRRRVKSPPLYHLKSSLLPAVEVIHPGASYNPSYAQHQLLLEQAAKVEQQSVKRELKLKRALSVNEPLGNEVTYLQEMSAGLFDDDDGGNTEELGKGVEELNGNAEETISNLLESESATLSKMQRKKLRKKRLREQQAKEAKLIKARQKEENRRTNAIYSLKRITAELKVDETKSKTTREKNMKKTLDKRKQAGRLSKYRFEEAQVELQTTVELTGSLRLLRPEGSVLEDRFKSIQKRNLVETRIRQKRSRKYKMKRFETKAYKQVSESTKPI